MVVVVVIVVVDVVSVVVVFVVVVVVDQRLNPNRFVAVSDRVVGIVAVNDVISIV